MFDKMIGADGMNNMMAAVTGRMFKRADGVVWDITTGKIGIQQRGSDSIFTIDEEDEDGERLFFVTESLINMFGTSVPAYAQNTPWENVRPGDLILNGKGVYKWVTKVGSKSIFLLGTDSTETRMVKGKVQGLGFDASGVMVVRTMFDAFGGDTSKNGIQQMLMPMLISGGMNDNGDVSEMMEMMLMMNLMNPQGNQPQQNTQPIALPPQPVVPVPVDIPDNATAAQARKIAKENSDAMLEYISAMKVWQDACQVINAQNAQATVSQQSNNPFGNMFGNGANPMMQLMLMKKLMGKGSGNGSNKVNFFDQVGTTRR